MVCAILLQWPALQRSWNPSARPFVDMGERLEPLVVNQLVGLQQGVQLVAVQLQVVAWSPVVQQVTVPPDALPQAVSWSLPAQSVVVCLAVALLVVVQLLANLAARCSKARGQPAHPVGHRLACQPAKSAEKLLVLADLKH